MSPIFGLLPFAVLFVFTASTAATDITGPVRVIDGDTIEIAGERIRLHGIDAPESKQICTDENGEKWHCGQEATFALANIVGDESITCRAVRQESVLAA